MSGQLTMTHPVDGGDRRRFPEVMGCGWFALVLTLGDIVTRATMRYAFSNGLQVMHLPLTTRTITCPAGPGSDAKPVPVVVEGVQTYLSDSAQFLLEYGCRLAPHGTYCLLPSFRADPPDETHLSQFTHSEAELPGGLDDVISYVEGYVRHLAGAVIDECGSALAASVGDVSHVERLAQSGNLPRVTHAEAFEFLASVGAAPELTRTAERHLLSHFGEFFWLTHAEHLSVPFYQAFDGEDNSRARNGDLYFGLGEIVGAGERHVSADRLRLALRQRGIAAEDYDWYLRMKHERPMLTSGFGLGVERFLAWLLRHDDVRDIPIVSRVGESEDWPSRVDRP